MGWKEFFHKTFESEWNEGKNWGGLYPVILNIGEEQYYCVGYASSEPADWVFSPKIQIPQGVKVRITIRYFFWVVANAYGTASIGIMFYKDGESAKDVEGHNVFGASHTPKQVPTSNLAEKHVLVMEYDGTNKITWYADDKKLGEAILELPLVSFVVGVAVKEASGGDVGILIYEVVGEYYDMWEDWVNQLYGIMQWIVPIMFVIMFIPMIVSILRSPRKSKEER
mgnify:CR=1 FL=1